MAILKKIEDLFQKRKIIFLVLFFLLFCQLVFGFLYPSSLSDPPWLSLSDLISHPKYSLDSAGVSIIDKFYPLLSNYYLNADGGQYVLLAENFPKHYFEGSTVFLARPLYSFLISCVAFLPRLFFDSFATVFASAIFLNFILALGTILLFYFLIEKLISSRVAFLSSFLFIFSPFVRGWLVQPLPEMLGTFMVIASIYLLYNYIQNSSYLKLIVFSLIVGTFMLGKMFFAISFFILILALYFRRYKEGFLFLVIHLIPLGIWYLWVTKVFGISYHVNEVVCFDMGVWLFNIFHWHWHQTAQIFFSAVPKFISSVIYGFLLVPIIFAFIGFKELILKRKYLFCSSLIFSFFILFFIMDHYLHRHSFLLFPVIYPLTVLGIDRVADFLKGYNRWYSSIFYLVIFIFLIAISYIFSSHLL